MKTLPILALILALASCADDKPVPPSVRTETPKAIPVLDLTKLEKSGNDVSNAADRVAEANAKAQTTAQQLKATMERARAYEQGGEQFRKAWEESEKFAAQLERDLGDSNTENTNLKEHVKALTVSLAVAKADNVSRDRLITDQYEKLTDAYKDIESLNRVRDDLVASRAETKAAEKRVHELLVENGKKDFKIGCLIAACAALFILSGYLALRNLLP